LCNYLTLTSATALVSGAEAAQRAHVPQRPDCLQWAGVVLGGIPGLLGDVQAQIRDLGLHKEATTDAVLLLC